MAEQFTPTGTTELNGAPESFAGLNPQPIAKAAPAQAPSAQAGIIGGNATSKGVISSTSDYGTAGVGSLLGGFISLAEPMIKKRIAEVNQQGVWEGMQRQAAGESIEQLQAEQNPILQIMGQESPLVRGGQMMASITASSALMSELNGMLPDLAAMPADEAQKIIMERAQATIGGVDGAAQAMLQAQLAEMVPNLLVARNKAAVGHMQTQLFNGSVDALVAQSTQLKSMRESVNKGVMSQTDLDQQAGRMQSLWTMDIDGITESAKDKVRFTALDSMLTNRNVEGYEYLTKTPEFMRLTQEQRDTLTVKARSTMLDMDAEGLTVAGPSLEFNTLIAGFRAGKNLDMTPEQLDAEFAKINVKTNATAGTTEMSVLTNRHRNQALAAQAAAREAYGKLQARAAEGAQTAQDNDMLYASAINSPDNVNLSHMTKDELGVRGDSYYAKAVSEKNSVLLNNLTRMWASKPDTIPAIFSQRASRVSKELTSGMPLTPQSMATVQELAAVAGNPQYGAGALASLVGTEQAGLLMELGTSGVDVTDSKALTEQVNFMKARRRSTPSAGDRAKAQEYLDDNQTNWVQRVFGVGGDYDRLAPEAQRKLNAEMAQEVAAIKVATQLDDDTTVVLAGRNVRGKFSIVAGRLVGRTPFMRESDTVLGAFAQTMPAKAVNMEFFDSAVDSAAKATLAKQGIAGKLVAYGGQELGGGAVYMNYIAETGPYAGRSFAVRLQAKSLTPFYEAERKKAVAVEQNKQKSAAKVTLGLNPGYGKFPVLKSDLSGYTKVNPSNYSPSDIFQGIDGGWYLKK